MAIEIYNEGYKRIAWYEIHKTLSTSSIKIYQGTPPVNAAAYDSASSASDLLVEFLSEDISVSSQSSLLKSFINVSDPVLKQATGTGTASWFAIDDGTNVITGTVSNQSGAGDMWVRDVNVVSGNDVEIISFEFTTS